MVGLFGGVIMSSELREKFFQEATREAKYFLDDMPRAVIDRARYNIWALATFFGGVFVFIKTADVLGLVYLIPSSTEANFFIAVTALLSMASLLFALRGSSVKKLKAPNLEFLWSKYKKNAGNPSSSEISIDELERKWIEHLIEITENNRTVYFRGMKDVTISYYLLVASIVASAIIPAGMVYKLIFD